MNNLIITSPAFQEGGLIPLKFSCKGDNINPILEIKSLPAETKSLAVVVEDPDAPSGVFDHWVAWNLPPSSIIDENSKAGVQGTNGRGEVGYAGPCPPSGTHRYQFKVYALDRMLSLPAGTHKKNLLNVIGEHVIAGGELTGKFGSPAGVNA